MPSALQLLWLVPALPLAGFLANGVLALRRPRAKHAVSIIGVGVLLAALALAIVIVLAFLREGTPGPLVFPYWEWMPVGDLHVTVALQLDQLSAVMLLVVTGVSSLIHVFSVGYMGEDPGYARYFAYLNLFVCITLLLFLGCTGKSAQIPLYTWLPDAMQGPTPVSALIHAATMVTAGVYLVARCNVLYALAPVASAVVAGIGALTAFFAATIALKQWDIKRVLAYSTVSQLGYMFLGVGSGAYAAGIFHLVTHAFFKALLFLGSGSVIHALHRAYHATHSHEDAQDMRNMGGLARHLPWTSKLMWVATLALAGIPPFAGFFSKDAILSAAFSLGDVHPLWYVYWLLGLLAALLTAFYMTRLMLYTFHGPNRTGERESAHLHEGPWLMTGPLVVLGALSVAGGALNVPALFRGHAWLEHWLEPVTAVATRLRPAIEVPLGTEWTLVIAAVAVAALGIFAALRLLRPEELVPARLAPAERGFARLLWKKWYVDEIYDFLLVWPLVWLSREVLWKTIDLGLIDGAGVNGAARLSQVLGWVGSRLQTGQLGFYVVLFVGGVLAVLWTSVR